jgi:hypothetical protein
MQIPLYFRNGDVKVIEVSKEFVERRANFIWLDFPLMISTCVKKKSVSPSNVIRHEILFRLEEVLYQGMLDNEPRRIFMYLEK